MTGPNPIYGRHDTEWMTDAACNGADPEAFFPALGAHPADVEYAKTLCRTCPVQTRCLEYALANEGGKDTRFGIYGGLSPKQRDKLVARRKEDAA